MAVVAWQPFLFNHGYFSYFARLTRIFPIFVPKVKQLVYEQKNSTFLFFFCINDPVGRLYTKSDSER